MSDYVALVSALIWNLKHHWMPARPRLHQFLSDGAVAEFDKFTDIVVMSWAVIQIVYSFRKLPRALSMLFVGHVPSSHIGDSWLWHKRGSL
jgi:hypothetical protein